MGNGPQKTSLTVMDLYWLRQSIRKEYEQTFNCRWRDRHSQKVTSFITKQVRKTDGVKNRMVVLDGLQTTKQALLAYEEAIDGLRSMLQQKNNLVDTKKKAA